MAFFTSSGFSLIILTSVRVVPISVILSIEMEVTMTQIRPKSTRSQEKRSPCESSVIISVMMKPAPSGRLKYFFAIIGITSIPPVEEPARSTMLSVSPVPSPAKIAFSMRSWVSTTPFSAWLQNSSAIGLMKELSIVDIPKPLPMKMKPSNKVNMFSASRSGGTGSPVILCNTREIPVVPLVRRSMGKIKSCTTSA